MLDELNGHAVEDVRNSKESFVGLANVVETSIIQQDLLDNKNSHLEPHVVVQSDPVYRP